MGTSFNHLPINLRIQPRHPRRRPEPLGPLAGGMAEANSALGIFEHPADTSSKILCVEGLS